MGISFAVRVATVPVWQTGSRYRAKTRPKTKSGSGTGFFLN